MKHICKVCGNIGTSFTQFGIECGPLCDSCCRKNRKELQERLKDQFPVRERTTPVYDDDMAAIVEIFHHGFASSPADRAHLAAIFVRLLQREQSMIATVKELTKAVETLQDQIELLRARD